MFTVNPGEGYFYISFSTAKLVFVDSANPEVYKKAKNSRW